MDAPDVIYPQFATHNALTVAAVLAIAPDGAVYEFQRLHGMGQALYDVVRADTRDFPRVRVYAPVGTHEDLLPYLVRRLLENGANTSFVHHFLNKDIPVEQVVGQIMGKAIPDSAADAAAAGNGSAARIREPGDSLRHRGAIPAARTSAIRRSSRHCRASSKRPPPTPTRADPS